MIQCARLNVCDVIPKAGVQNEHIGPSDVVIDLDGAFYIPTTRADAVTLVNEARISEQAAAKIAKDLYSAGRLAPAPQFLGETASNTAETPMSIGARLWATTVALFARILGEELPR